MKYFIFKKFVLLKNWANCDKNEKKLVRVLAGFAILLLLDIIALIFG